MYTPGGEVELVSVGLKQGQGACVQNELLCNANAADPYTSSLSNKGLDLIYAKLYKEKKNPVEHFDWAIWW